MLNDMLSIYFTRLGVNCFIWNVIKIYYLSKYSPEGFIYMMLSVVEIEAELLDSKLALFMLTK